MEAPFRIDSNWTGDEIEAAERTVDIPVLGQGWVDGDKQP
jgi:hypothetical protein